MSLIGSPEQMQPSPQLVAAFKENAALRARIAELEAAAPSAAQAAGVDAAPARHAIRNLRAYLTNGGVFPNGAIGVLENFIDATTPSEGVAAPVEHEAKTTSKLTLAVIGRRHFGNPIPQEWYAAAHDLLADVAQAAPAQPSADQVRVAALEEAARAIEESNGRITFLSGEEAINTILTLRTTASSEQSAGGFGGGARNSDGSFVISTGGGGARNSDGSFVISAAGGGVPGARGAGGEKGADRG